MMGSRRFMRNSSFGSSSGVQIIGGRRPAERQIASIVPRIAAFAMCLQFHVRRNSTSWAAVIAICSASTVAFCGNAPRRTSSPASFVAASVRGRTGSPRSALSRRARSIESPPAASSSTTCETTFVATLSASGITREARGVTAGLRTRWARRSPITADRPAITTDPPDFGRPARRDSGRVGTSSS
jgi:hypothetical protein